MLTDSEASYLSIGCGNGYIESQNADDYRIEAFDFSTQATQWLQEQNRVKIHVDWTTTQQAYDVIFAIQLVYSLSENELEKLFEDVNEHLAPGGEFVFSFTPPPNDMTSVQLLKKLVRLCLTHTLWRGQFQFWGWMRPEEFYIDLIQGSGFVLLDSQQTTTDSILRCRKT